MKIEKMIYGGDGLARLPEDSGKSQTVFLPFVLPGEEVEARITERGRSFSRARVEKIVTASDHRVEAKCPYFLRCGGCHYQHSDYPHQLEIKTQILRETLLRTAKLDWQQPITTHSAEPWNYRNRTRMKVRAGGKEFAMGYYRFASHDLLPVEECPISSPLINRMVSAIWSLGRAGRVPAGIGEIEFFGNAEDEEILLELYLSGDVDQDALKAFAERLRAAVPECIGLAAFAGESNRPVKMTWSEGETELLYQTREDHYHVRAGSFFQTNRFLTDELVKLVAGNERGESAMDLYAGTGLFTLPLARGFKKVVAVEAALASYADLRTNAAENVECYKNTTEDFLAARKGNAPELVVADPPRAGLGDKVTSALVKMAAPRVTYVSCDPATLARDLGALVIGGYRVKSVDLIDLFPQTFHIETVVKLSR
jgi:23S rRNA (uracil1939-C5)-methyltransferase